MRISDPLRLLLLLLLVSLSSSVGLVPSAAAQPGSSGLAFLKLGVSGRGVAMSDAMSSSVSGAEASHYNPAGLLIRHGGEPGVELLLTHMEWIQDARLEHLAASIPLNEENAVGITVRTTSVANIEIRDRPGEAQGTFTARNLLISASYARQLSADVRVGATAKYLYEKLLVDEASGYGIDLGGQWDTPVEGLSVGCALANVGRMSDLRVEKSKLPTLLRLGPSYTVDFSNVGADLTVAADGLYILPENRIYLNVGGEVLLNRMIAARAGYQFGSEGRGFSAGVGVQYSLLELQYAYAPLAADLGNTHTISLSLHF